MAACLSAIAKDIAEFPPATFFIRAWQDQQGLPNNTVNAVTQMRSNNFPARSPAVLLEHRSGPLQARDDRLEQPFHAERVIVHPPQINMRGHPCSGRVRAVCVAGSERELKSLKNSLKICPRLQ